MDKKANTQKPVKSKNNSKVLNIANDNYSNWAVFQGREDAQMLQEKQSHWNAKNDSLGVYDSEDD